jgi:hypothetical protein
MTLPTKRPKPDGMSKGERDELAKLVRAREKVAKGAVAERAAELLADFEKQIATIHSYDDQAVWREAHKAADRAVAEADAKVAARCRELGIPEDWRPKLDAYWYGRGENASEKRRLELRKVAKTRIDALQKRALVHLQAESLKLQTQLVVGGLQSDEARAFLAAMPTVEALMPPLDPKEIDARLPITRGLDDD